MLEVVMEECKCTPHELPMFYGFEVVMEECKCTPQELPMFYGFEVVMEECKCTPHALPNILWLGPELSSVAWSDGAQLIFSFCFRFSVVLFDRQGISIRNATHCICRVLVFASS